MSTGNVYFTLTGLAGSNALKEANPASYDPGSWENATVSWEAVHSDYQVKQESSVDPFRFISESTVESKAKNMYVSLAHFMLLDNTMELLHMVTRDLTL